MNDINNILCNDLIALDRLVVHGIDNCMIVVALSNDIKRILQLLSEQNQKQKKESDEEVKTE